MLRFLGVVILAATMYSSGSSAIAGSFDPRVIQQEKRIMQQQEAADATGRAARNAAKDRLKRMRETINKINKRRLSY